MAFRTKTFTFTGALEQPISSTRLPVRQLIIQNTTAGNVNIRDSANGLVYRIAAGAFLVFGPHSNELPLDLSQLFAVGGTGQTAHFAYIT
jgi:hypothetical protein